MALFEPQICSFNHPLHILIHSPRGWNSGEPTLSTSFWLLQRTWTTQCDANGSLNEEALNALSISFSSVNLLWVSLSDHTAKDNIINMRLCPPLLPNPRNGVQREEEGERSSFLPECLASLCKRDYSPWIKLNRLIYKLWNTSVLPC